MNTSVVSNEQFKLLIPGYPEGSNITLINTSYVPRVRMKMMKENLIIQTIISLSYLEIIIQEKNIHIQYSNHCIRFIN